MIRHCSGIVCVATTADVLSRLGSGADGGRQPRQAPDGFRGQRGRRRGRDDGDQRGGPRADDPHHRRPRRASRSSWRARATCFPCARGPGGVLERAGHTEAAVDLAILAGLHPSGVLCELMNDDGTVARLGDIVRIQAPVRAPDDLDRRAGAPPREFMLRIARRPGLSSRRSMSGDSPAPEPVDASGLKIAIAAARFNGPLVDALLGRGPQGACRGRASGTATSRS